MKKGIFPLFSHAVTEGTLISDRLLITFLPLRITLSDYHEGEGGLLQSSGPQSSGGKRVTSFLANRGLSAQPVLGIIDAVYVACFIPEFTVKKRS